MLGCPAIGPEQLSGCYEIVAGGSVRARPSCSLCGRDMEHCDALTILLWDQLGAVSELADDFEDVFAVGFVTVRGQEASCDQDVTDRSQFGRDQRVGRFL